MQDVRDFWGLVQRACRPRIVRIILAIVVTWLLAQFVLGWWNGHSGREIAAGMMQNVFVRAIVLPVVFAGIVAALEFLTALVRGKSDGPNKYRVWVEVTEGGRSVVRPVPNLSLEAVFKQPGIIEIESMPSFDFTEFSTIGLDLIIAAISIDIVAAIDLARGLNPATATATLPVEKPWATLTVLIGVLCVHLILLISILAFCMLNRIASPQEGSAKKRWSFVTLVLGLVAMMLAFLVV